MSLSVAFADTEREHCLGNQIEWHAEYCEMPESKQIPKLSERGSERIRLPGGRTIQVPNINSIGLNERLNPYFYHHLADYTFMRRLVRKVRLVVTNSGDAPANDVRLEICAPNGSGFGVIRCSEIPDAPKRRESIVDRLTGKHFEGRPAFSRSGVVHIEKNEHETKVEIDCGNLQPGRKVWTDEFHMGVTQSGVVQINGWLFADNLPKPQGFILLINAQITRTEMTVNELTALDAPDDGEE